MTEEKMFEIAAAIYSAHVRSGQQMNGKDLLDECADLLPAIFDTVRRSWNERNVVQDMLDAAKSEDSSGLN